MCLFPHAHLIGHIFPCRLHIWGFIRFTASWQISNSNKIYEENTVLEKQVCGTRTNHRWPPFLPFPIIRYILPLHVASIT